MIIRCKAEDWKCPYIDYCLARLNDRSIIGCGIPLYMSGIITESEIKVLHEIKKTESPDGKYHRKIRKRGQHEK